MSNIDIAIEVMERTRDAGRKLEMNEWTDVLPGCGSVACFGGYISQSPEWRRNPGHGARPSGEPSIVLEEGVSIRGSDAIAEWLDIDAIEACYLCMTETCSLGSIYNENPTFDEVIKNLEILKAGGSLESLAEVCDS